MKQCFWLATMIACFLQIRNNGCEKSKTQLQTELDLAAKTGSKNILRPGAKNILRPNFGLRLLP